MAGSVQTLNKPIVRENWSVAFPPGGGSVESGIFYLEGKAWKFKLLTTFSYGVNYRSMHIMKCNSIITGEKFWLAAYVGNGTSVYCMTHIEIPTGTGSYQIWNYTDSQFLQSYPRINTTGKIDFSFVIVNLRRDSGTFVKEPKLVQTPSYSDDRRCLDNLSAALRKLVDEGSYSDDRRCLDNLSAALRKLVDEGSDSDVQLKCGECSIAAHRLILGTRSEVFRTMLQSDMLEKRQGVVEIVDMEPKVFEIFIRYLYTGNLPKLTEDTATSLYEAADKYQVEVLRGRCGDFLAGNLTRENALGILAMVDAHSDKGLKDRVVTYVLNEQIPTNESEWSKFCDDHPKLANEVLNRSYKELICYEKLIN